MTQVIESKKIADVLLHADEKTLVILDVDNTLIMPKVHVGGAAWFMHMIKELCGKGMDEQEAIEKIYAVFVQLQHLIPVKTVESDTAAVVQKLHERNIKTLGLTGRGFALARQTVAQLESVDIMIDANTIHDQEIVFDPQAGFFKGILSLEAEGDKGARLIALFEKIDYKPERIVFVDDIQGYIDDVHRVAVSRQIPFVGMRYGAADEQHHTFDSVQADGELRQLLLGAGHQALLKQVLL